MSKPRYKNGLLSRTAAAGSTRTPWLERVLLLLLSIPPLFILSDDNNVVLLQVAAQYFRHSPVSQPGANKARLHVVLARENPYDRPLTALALLAALLTRALLA
jgi:hypothetical protein